MVELWDLSNCTLSYNLPNIKLSNLLQFSPDSEYLVSTTGAAQHDQDAIRIWAIGTGKLLWVGQMHTKGPRLRNFEFSPNSQYLAIHLFGGEVMIRNALTGKLHFETSTNIESYSHIAFICDGSQLACFSDGMIKLWSLTSRKLQATINAESTIAYAMVSSMKSTYIVMNLYHAIRCIDLQTLTTQTINDVGIGSKQANLSEDDKVVICHRYNGQLTSYSLENGQIQRTIDAGDNLEKLTFVPGQQSIETNRGIISLEPNHHGKGSQYIYITDDWMTINEEKRLWIPPLYRPSAIDYHDGKLVMGFQSGRILLFDCITGTSTFLV